MRPNFKRYTSKGSTVGLFTIAWNALKKRQILIMTSVVTYTEITTLKIPAGVETMLEEVMQRPNCAKISIDMRVAKLARDLRNYWNAMCWLAGVALRYIYIRRYKGIEFSRVEIEARFEGMLIWSVHEGSGLCLKK